MAERWLVIDDSSTIQRVIKLAFQGYDVHITEADSIQDAAREMTAHTPSLVIADAALGGVQGVQDFLALKERASQAPFIILEGSYDNIDEAQFRAAGFKHFLKKPFDGSQLLNITRQALGRALPYRGEAAVAAQAVPPQPAAPMPPPPPPLRKTMAETSFPPESTSTGGFDLGLHDQRAPDPRAIAQTLVSTVDPRYAQTQIGHALDRNAAPGFANDRVMTNPHGMPAAQGFGNDRSGTNPHGIPATSTNAAPGFANDRAMTNPHGMPAAQGFGNDRSGTNPHGMPSAAQTQMALDIRGHGAQFNDPRGMESSGEFRQLPDSQAKGDTRSMIAAEARAMASAHLNAMSQSGSFGRKENGVETLRNPVSFSLEDDEPASQPAASNHWDGPRPAGSHLGNLLEPMLQEEMEKIVRVAVEDYCRKHFAGIARELIQRELDRLTQDRSRLLMD